jgi:hypothetical protein
MAGIKRSPSVKDVLRNTKDGFFDLVMVIACSLHNLRVDYRKKTVETMTKNLISDNVLCIKLHRFMKH